MIAKKSKHGGRRTPGPGKKLGAPTLRAEAKVPISARVSPSVRRFLMREGNLSEAIEIMARKSAEFPTWNANQGGGN